MTTTVEGAPYVVTIQDSGGLSLSDVVGLLTAVGTLAAVVVAVWVALRSARIAREEAARTHRRATIREVAEWLGELDAAEAHLGTINKATPPAPVMLAVDEVVKKAPETGRRLHALVQSTLRDPAPVISAMAELPTEAAQVGKDYWANAIQIVPAGQDLPERATRRRYADRFPLRYHTKRRVLLDALNAEDK